MAAMKSNWNPFYALEGTKDGVENEYNNQLKTEMTVLSAEKVEEIESVIMECFSIKCEICIKYFKNDFIKEYTGVIRKIDYINKVIMFSDFNVLASNIIDAVKVEY